MNIYKIQKLHKFHVTLIHADVVLYITNNRMTSQALVLSTSESSYRACLDHRPIVPSSRSQTTDYQFVKVSINRSALNKPRFKTFQLSSPGSFILSMRVKDKGYRVETRLGNDLTIPTRQCLVNKSMT